MTDPAQNPYAAPTTYTQPPRAQGVLSGRLEDLVAVARYHRYIILCIVAYLALAIGSTALQGAVAGSELELPLTIVTGLMVIPIVICGVVFTILLSTKVMGRVAGVLLGLLCVVPLINVLVLLVLSSRATKIIRENGYRVGFFGADLSQFQHPQSYANMTAGGSFQPPYQNQPGPPNFS